MPENDSTGTQNSAYLDSNETDYEHAVTTLTQEQLDNQVKAHLTPISQPLVDLTKVIQGPTQKLQPKIYAATNSRAQSSTPEMSSYRYDKN